MILEEITNKLKEIDSLVFYGGVNESEVISEWNYIVFARKALSVSDNKQSYSDRYLVNIIRENFIPEGLDISVIDKVCEIAGMRLANAESQYSYTKKPNTNTVVEILTIEFVRARKRVVA